MYMVRGCAPPTGAASPEAERAILVPHEPQNANVGCTVFPQLGHGISPDAGDGAAGRGATIGAATVLARAAPEGAPPSTRAAVAPTAWIASGLGGSWNEGRGPEGAGIFGESFQGIPLRGLAAGDAGDVSSPAAVVSGIPTDTLGGGGRTVRAVSSSSVDSIACGAGTTGSGVGPGVGVVGGET